MTFKMFLIITIVFFIFIGFLNHIFKFLKIKAKIPSTELKIYHQHLIAIHKTYENNKIIELKGNNADILKNENLNNIISDALNNEEDNINLPNANFLLNQMSNMFSKKAKMKDTIILIAFILIFFGVFIYLYFTGKINISEEYKIILEAFIVFLPLISALIIYIEHKSSKYSPKTIANLILKNNAIEITFLNSEYQNVSNPIKEEYNLSETSFQYKLVIQRDSPITYSHYIFLKTLNKIHKYQIILDERTPDLEYFIYYLNIISKNLNPETITLNELETIIKSSKKI